MNSSALAFMIGAWLIIFAASFIGLYSLIKHQK